MNDLIGPCSDFLNKIVTVKVDRPMGSRHPRHGFIYPVNYGYIPETISGDGEELDAYILGIYEPLETFTGKCIAIIHRTNDNDDKLIVVPENLTFTNNEIRVLTDFQERFFDSEIIRDKLSIITTEKNYKNGDGNEYNEENVSSSQERSSYYETGLTLIQSNARLLLLVGGIVVIGVITIIIVRGKKRKKKDIYRF